MYASLTQKYSLADLSTFETAFNLPQQSKSIINIGDGYTTGACIKSDDCMEANLDIQYLTGLSQVTPTTGWFVNSTTNTNPFNAWIMAMANTKNPPLVMSISYGAYESGFTPGNLNQWNTEAMILGTMGVTIVVSSGDQGVSGFLYQIYPKYPVSSFCGYAPQFPASSPYVVTAGGTQGQPEIAAQCDQGGTITTGGGFSNYYGIPSYQKSQVNTYLQNINSSTITPPYQNPSQNYPISGVMNSSGRAYPDIAAWSSYVQVIIGGKTMVVSGTSVSAPGIANCYF